MWTPQCVIIMTMTHKLHSVYITFLNHAVPMLTVIENIEDANDELSIVAILA